MSTFYFRKEREAGIEQWLGNIICEFNGASGLAFPTGRFPDYDCCMTRDDKPITYELKSDWASKSTGNVFLETGNYSKASGLTVTKATRVSYYIPDRNLAVTFPPQEMLIYLSEHTELKRKCGVGDGNSNGILLPLVIFTGLAFCKVHTLPPYPNY